MVPLLPLSLSTQPSAEEGQQPPTPGSPWSGEGQVLAGVANLNGIDFGIKLNRMEFGKRGGGDETNQPRLDNDTFSQGDYISCTGKLYVKILGFDEKAAYKGVDKRTEKLLEKYKSSGMEGDIRGVLTQGFIGVVDLHGWWDSRKGRLRTKPQKPGDISDMSWMAYFAMPWQELDCRFDNLGAKCSIEVKRDPSYLTFRLDAQEPAANPARVFLGKTELQNVAYSISLNLDECKGTEQEGYECDMKMMPLALTVEEREKRDAMYASNPQVHGLHLKEGPWFTYMGMVGHLRLKLQKGRHYRYSAKVLGSECWGQEPCPFLDVSAVIGAFRVQLLPSKILLEPAVSKAALKLKVTTTVWKLYPVYDKNTMEVSPDGENPQFIDKTKETLPIQDRSGFTKKAAKEEQMQQDMLEMDARMQKQAAQLSECRSKFGSSSLQLNEEPGKVDEEKLADLDEMQDSLYALKQKLEKLQLHHESKMH